MSSVVLAYSGGLDTSVLLKRLILEGHSVVAMTADLGESDAMNGAQAKSNLLSVQQKAIALGAKDALLIDSRERFADEFISHALKANATYEGAYPLSAALSRPLIAELLVETAKEFGADAVVHGCTGKGNDQVRIEVSVRALEPALRCVAPLRDRPLTRPEAIAFAREHGVEVPHSALRPYSIDANLWGRSIEAGILEDPWTRPPEDVFAWTASCERATAAEIVLTFGCGLPVALDGKPLKLAALVAVLNGIAGSCGVGRIDQVENRLVGIKSREVYEAPAAVTLLYARRVLESLVLTRDEMRFSEIISKRYADLIYDGLWLSPLRLALDSCVDTMQSRVTGDVRLTLRRGAVELAGVRSRFSLYDQNLATYSDGDSFDHSAAGGFIQLWSLPLVSASLRQRAEMVTS